MAPAAGAGGDEGGDGGGVDHFAGAHEDGQGVSGWSAGDAVVAFLPMTEPGAAAEYVAAPAGAPAESGRYRCSYAATPPSSPSWSLGSMPEIYRSRWPSGGR